MSFKYKLKADTSLKQIFLMTIKILKKKILQDSKSFRLKSFLASVQSSSLELIFNIRRHSKRRNNINP